MPQLTMNRAAARLALSPVRTRRQAGLTTGLVATVVLLTAIAPLATDMYVPAFRAWPMRCRPAPPRCS